MKIVILISSLIVFTLNPSLAEDDLEYGLCPKDLISYYNVEQTVRPHTEICYMRKDLFDGIKYLKSLCIIRGLYTYEELRKICADNNMNAFIIDDAIVETHFFDATTYLLRAYRGGVVWINGKRSDDQWNVFNLDQTIAGPLFEDISWANKYTSGDCLKFSSIHGQYQALPASCNDRHWGVCEHHKRTEYPTDLDVSHCRYKKALYVDGQYIKSMCIIETGDTYDEARQRCARHGMNLFIIDSAELELVFHQSTTQFLSPYPNGAVWINGMRDEDSHQWMVYNQNRKPKGTLFDGLDWIANGEKSGNCLTYAGKNGLYKSMGYPCDTRHWVVCEYDD
ncbi:hypothetical protein ACKWTF_000684 [Chironomus riparius]